MQITFHRPTSNITDGVIALPINQQNKRPEITAKIDEMSDHCITRTLKHQDFSGKAEELLEILSPPNLQASHLLLFGGGGGDKTRHYFRNLGAQLIRAASKSRAETLHILVADLASNAEQICDIAYGAAFCAYHFDKYLNPQKKTKTHKIKSLKIYSNYDCKSAFHATQALLQGVTLSRDLVSMPPNELYPESFAEQCLALQECGLKVTVLDENELEKLGFRALLGVGQGSARPSRVVVMQWEGGEEGDGGDGTGNAKKAPLAFIGKGVTFDSGGISLKPGPGMQEMKWDMAGAATVTGLMKVLALRKAPVSAVGLIGLVENMPGGRAQRPGDIVKSYDGQSIEIHNTDAEGRLVLADLLGYCETQWKPEIMIDLATLTGAIIIALGHEYAGLFSNDDSLAKQLVAAGSDCGDKLWRMPLHANYDKALNTSHADMKNIGGRDAGSITAAQFLQRFVKKTKWAHLDIAGVAWWSKQQPNGRIGASGFGVALLDNWVKNYQQK